VAVTQFKVLSMHLREGPERNYEYPQFGITDFQAYITFGTPEYDGMSS
jgi:hypothetical protein